MTRSALRTGSTAIKQATLRAVPTGHKRRAAKRKTAAPHWSTGIALGAAGPRRYRLYTPPGVRRNERLPLLVMLHGCGQNAEALADCSHMNQVARRERFLVLYPEQDRLANAQGCWNWFDTRSGRAQGEAGAIDAAIDQVCLLHPADPQRVALAGFSAGAGMAALLATLRPERFRAVVMHSGIAPGIANSSLTALRAMSGHAATSPPPSTIAAATRFPALLVIHGSADSIVVPGNGAEAARMWAALAGAKPTPSHSVQRGARYPATITQYRHRGRLVATLCEVVGLGHAWSGGSPGHAFSDSKGPDGARMIWSFVSRQLADSVE